MENLKKNNIFLPTADTLGVDKIRHLEVKEMARFFDYVRSNYTEEALFGSRIKKFVASIRKKNGNVLISAEGLSILEPSGVKSLANLFHDFQVTVIMIYRAFGCRLLSLFNQVQKTTNNPEHAFTASLLFRYMDSPWIEDFYMLAQRYSAVFGRENMVIIDYYGVDAAGMNIAQVFLCNALNVTKFCTSRGGDSNNLIKNDKILNPSRDVRKDQLDALFEIYAAAHDCSYRDKENGYFIRDKVTWRHTPRPVATNFTFLKSHSMYVDERVREKYAKYIIYGNSTANELALTEELRFQEVVPVAALRYSANFVSEMKSTLLMLKNKKLCKKLK